MIEVFGPLLSFHFTSYVGSNGHPPTTDGIRFMIFKPDGSSSPTKRDFN